MNDININNRLSYIIYRQLKLDQITSILILLVYVSAPFEQHLLLLKHHFLKTHPMYLYHSSIHQNELLHRHTFLKSIRTTLILHVRNHSHLSNNFDAFPLFAQEKPIICIKQKHYLCQDF